MFEQHQDPKYFKESGKVVNNFIRRKNEKIIKKFFLEEIDNMLKYYEPGRPNMKPDVLLRDPGFALFFIPAEAGIQSFQ